MRAARAIANQLPVLCSRRAALAAVIRVVRQRHKVRNLVRLIDPMLANRGRHRSRKAVCLQRDRVRYRVRRRRHQAVRIRAKTSRRAEAGNRHHLNREALVIPPVQRRLRNSRQSPVVLATLRVQRLPHRARRNHQKGALSHPVRRANLRYQRRRAALAPRNQVSCRQVHLHSSRRARNRHPAQAKRLPLNHRVARTNRPHTVRRLRRQEAARSTLRQAHRRHRVRQVLVQTLVCRQRRGHRASTNRLSLAA